MIIGFTERVRTVPENGVDEFDLNPLLVAIATLRTSERDHFMIFRYLESDSRAIVDPLDISTANFDVIFGIRDRPSNPIEVHLDLEAGESLIQPLFLSIRNDFVLEEEECFTLRIIPADVPGRDELFKCNEDGENADNYYCEHTICIADDDGKLVLLKPMLLGIINAFVLVTAEFVVEFVKTAYTVDESVGQVTVCVNLTQPQIDILDESVNVFVADNLNFPTGSHQASK